MDEAYFKTYFGHISSVTCDKAKEHVEKQKTTQPVVLQGALTQFAQCEKSYYSLVFMEQKWFGRKDPLKNAYFTLASELQDFSKLIGKGDLQGGTSICVTVADELSSFCQCRIECIELYESSIRSTSLEELEKSVSALISKCAKGSGSKSLKPITDSFVSEFLTFQKLIRSSIMIAEWNFFNSLIELHKIRSTLALWQPLLSKDQHHTYSFRPGLLGFGERRSSSPVSAIYQWMGRYFQELVSKFSLYFFDSLNKMDCNDNVKAAFARTSYDYVGKIMSFCKKLDSCYVLLYAIASESTLKYIDDANKMTHAQILELPTTIPSFLHSNLDTFLYNKSEDISIEKVTYFYDKTVKYSFYAVQTDPGMIFVVSVLGKKSEKDSFVLNFITETVSRLQPKRIFAMLKPGVK